MSRASTIRRQAVAKRPLRVLIVEDRDDDLVLLLCELDRAGYAASHVRVDTVAALRSALATETDWELVLSDFSLPTMTAHDVLRILETDRPDLPCIVISGTITEEAAVDVLKAGARDFVVKQRMARLLPAIERELREGAERRRLLDAEATLHETRERMQFALESVGVGFWEWDRRSGKVVWSEVQERLHGLQPGTFGGTLEAFIATVHVDDREEMRRRVHSDDARRVAGDSRVEYRTTWPDGSEHWILSIGRTRFDQVTSLDAAGVSLDITAQKRLEDQVRQAQKMESIGNLAGGIAHDFNNLLTVITGCCDLAAPGLAADSEAAESLEGIRSAAVSASALTRQLLTFSRRQIVTPRLLNLNETIAGFRPILRRLVEENVQIDFTLASSPHLVSIDPGQLEQVLLNLVANARDAMPSGGILTIGTSDASPHDEVPRPSDVRAGPYVLLSVCDTGSGMSQAVQSHAFEPFFTTKQIGQGTGLGLATVYGIVKQNEGHISIRSAPGSGTTFSVYLPVVCAPSDNAPAEETPKAVGLTGSETILVVEDNAPLRRLTARMLQRYGYMVLVASDGAQAQQICAEHQGPIPVVLMDVVMPGESGPTVGEWIRQRRADTKIIYTSGYTGYATDHGRVSGPGIVFLSKPFNAIQLARAVRDVLSSPNDAGAQPVV